MARIMALVPALSVGRSSQLFIFLLASCLSVKVESFSRTSTIQSQTYLKSLSSEYLENDLVSIVKDDGAVRRLCAVKPDGTVTPLCRREDDVETDLFADPREFNEQFWTEVTDEKVHAVHGEGFYGQRPVPSLGGGPGYGAEADEIWSATEDLIEAILEDGVEIPKIDMGISHGEKARGGSF